MTHPRLNHDGRVFGYNGAPDVFIPGCFWGKLLFVVYAAAMMGFGIWCIWGPATAFLFGTHAEARVVRVVRVAPGLPSQTIRVRRAFKDDSYDVQFQHYVEVEQADGTSLELRVAADSRRKPYAVVNDTFRVAYGAGSTVAYGVFQQRTWGFGAVFLLLGVTLLVFSSYLLARVGKPVIIDPESPEALAAEEQHEARERSHEVP